MYKLLLTLMLTLVCLTSSIAQDGKFKFKSTSITKYQLLDKDFNDPDNLLELDSTPTIYYIEITKETVSFTSNGEMVPFSVINIHEANDGTELHFALGSNGKTYTLELVYDEHCLRLVDRDDNLVFQFENITEIKTSSDKWKNAKL